MKHYGNRAGDEDTFSKWATNKQKHSITRQVNAYYQRLAYNRFFYGIVKYYEQASQMLSLST